MNTQQKLEEARQAFHDLATGRMARVFVDQNGERVEFNAGNSRSLLSYIEELKRMLGIAGRIVGPMRVYL
jgi:hypothetical protein